MRLLLTLYFYLAIASALAHDFGCGGTTVPPNVKTGCCGLGDAHLVGPNDERYPVIPLDHGAYQVTVNGYSRTFAQSDILPSNDGCYWAWWRTYPDDPTIFIACLMIPFST